MQKKSESKKVVVKGTKKETKALPCNPMFSF
jgi:hypothetical protein